MDFTLNIYKELLSTLQEQGFSFLPFTEKPFSESDKIVYLRHDVDLLPKNSLAIADIEHRLDIKGSYYFRIVPGSNQPGYIEQIRDLGHEIGYHYEDLALCQGNMIEAIESFEKNLAYFRKFYPVKTICMHGSPRSKYDSKDLWEKYDYRKLGIIGEPYMDLNFNEWFYLTDTGRRWDGWKTSVRDKLPQQEKWIREGLVFHSTNNIIKAAKKDQLPSKIMITVHPQRWTDKTVPWVRELVMQNVKNVVKRWWYV